MKLPINIIFLIIMAVTAFGQKTIEPLKQTITFKVDQLGNSEVEAGIVRPKYAIVTNTRALLKEKETTAIPRITKYTNKLY